ncbi:MAG: ATP-binding protein [Phaeodactylibacter sp.]|nr:ATP-binding protein [Phaeodactylibacter sp.]
MYGRRRCGKSTLIREVLPKESIYFMAPQADEAVQRAQLANVISARIKGFDQAIYPDWESLFISLQNGLERRTPPIALCLDEFPYLAKSSAPLPSLIQKMVDEMEQRSFHLILCGSSQQMMQGMVLDSTAPLYGRSNEILKIAPLEAGWLMDSLNCLAAQAVEEYATWGGVPRYWEIRQEYDTYEEAVKEAILDRLGILHEEPIRLFLDDMRESVQAYSILAVVGKGSHKLSEIAGRLNKPATHLARPMNRLIQLGYLKREIPFGESLKSGKRTLYKLADPFMNFYFSFVSPNLSRLELGLTEQVYEGLAPKLNSFFANEWENLCRRSVPMAPVSGLSFGQASRWWGANENGKMMELDLVAESVDKQHILVGECKWADVADSAPIFRNLIQKAQLLPGLENRSIVPALFAKSIKKEAGHDFQIFTPAEVMARLKR